MVRVVKFGSYGILSITFAFFINSLSAETAKETQASYDQMFQSGLKAEAAREWSEAIQFYLSAQAKSPQSPWPKERIQAIFTSLQKSDQQVALLETLLPPEMSAEFRKKGIIKDDYDHEADVSKLNFYLWGSLIFIFLAAGFGLFYLSSRSAKQEAEEAKLRTSVFAKKAAPKAKSVEGKIPKESAVPRETGALKKDVKITDKTRTEMDGIFSSVKSLAEESPKSETGSVDIEALNTSGVIEAFAQSMVSDVTSEESKYGKFSKMTLEASLLFDDDEEEKK
jgi:hypothetical protein